MWKTSSKTSFSTKKFVELVEDLYKLVVQLVENPGLRLDRLVECGLNGVQFDCGIMLVHVLSPFVY